MCRTISSHVFDTSKTNERRHQRSHTHAHALAEPTSRPLHRLIQPLPCAARREPGASDFLGYQKPLAQICDDGWVGRLVRERVLQRQPQPAVQHERIRGERLDKDRMPFCACNAHVVFFSCFCVCCLPACFPFRLRRIYYRFAVRLY